MTVQLEEDCMYLWVVWVARKFPLKDLCNNVFGQMRSSKMFPSTPVSLKHAQNDKNQCVTMLQLPSQSL